VNNIEDYWHTGVLDIVFLPDIANIWETIGNLNLSALYIPWATFYWCPGMVRSALLKAILKCCPEVHKFENANYHPSSLQQILSSI
jgi:hypothetical protein